MFGNVWRVRVRDILFHNSFSSLAEVGSCNWVAHIRLPLPSSYDRRWRDGWIWVSWHGGRFWVRQRDWGRRWHRRFWVWQRDWGRPSVSPGPRRSVPLFPHLALTSNIYANNIQYIQSIKFQSSFYLVLLAREFWKEKKSFVIWDVSVLTTSSLTYMN